jgi:hypothetical protein
MIKLTLRDVTHITEALLSDADAWDTMARNAFDDGDDECANSCHARVANLRRLAGAFNRQPRQATRLEVTA